MTSSMLRRTPQISNRSPLAKLFRVVDYFLPLIFFRKLNYELIPIFSVHSVSRLKQAMDDSIAGLEKQQISLSEEYAKGVITGFTEQLLDLMLQAVALKPSVA